MPDPKIRVVITADGKQYAAAIDRATGETKQLGQQSKKTAGEVHHLAGAVKLLSAGYIAFQVGRAVRGIVQVSTEVERLNASLVTVTGTQRAASDAMSWLSEFAAETPFQLQQVVEAFIKLQALGLDPSEEALRSYGNTASAMGKSLNQMIEAVADAATGEFERLKEFGIKARVEGDNVALTFRGVTTVVENNAREIETYLRRIGEVDFASGMSLQMDTLGGAFSNFEDAVFRAAAAIGEESGLAAGTKELLFVMGDLLDIFTRGEEQTDDLAEAWDDLTAAANEMTAPGGALQKLSYTLGVIGNQWSRLKNSTTFLGEAAAQLLHGDVSMIPEMYRKLGEKEGQLQTELADLQFGMDERRRVRAQRRRDRALDDYADAFVNDIYGPAPKPAGLASPSGEGGKRGRGKSAAERELEAYQQRLARLLDTLDPVAAKTRDYLQAVEDLDRAWAEGNISGAELDRLMLELAKSSEEAERGYSDLADTGVEAFERLEAAIQGWGRGITDTFVDVALTGKASFRDLANSVVADILRMQFHQNVTTPLLEQLIPTLAGGVSTAIRYDTNFFSEQTRMLTAQDAGLVFGGARAGGGDVAPGRAYLVGEKGPELLVPRGPGRVVANDQLGRVTVNVINNAGAEVTTRERQGPGGELSLDVIVEPVRGALMRDVQQGGPLARTLQRQYGLNRAAGRL